MTVSSHNEAFFFVIYKKSKMAVYNLEEVKIAYQPSTKTIYIKERLMIKDFTKEVMASVILKCKGEPAIVTTKDGKRYKVSVEEI